MHDIKAYNFEHGTRYEEYVRKSVTGVKTLQMRFCGNDNDDDGLYFNVQNSVSLHYAIQFYMLTIGLKDSRIEFSV